jgi:hypothetical protein
MFARSIFQVKLQIVKSSYIVPVRVQSHHKQQTTYYRKPRLDLIRLDSCVDDDGSKDVT